MTPPPPPPQRHSDVKCIKISLEMPPYTTLQQSLPLRPLVYIAISL